jgi:protein involved in polysaccharide export with SLBB domain
LIFPNDIIEFINDDSPSTKNGQVRFFFIGGDVASVGQKDFYEGMTLTQAILVSGGLKKESVKRVVIRRKNAEGMLVSNEFNLKLIKDGKVPDPVLEAGDTIEIGNWKMFGKIRFGVSFEKIQRSSEPGSLLLKANNKP